MKPKTTSSLADFEKKLFDIKDDPMPKGAWWWWFWLFFFDNPKDPEKPRQLMILWSTKNVKTIDCNDLLIKLHHPLNRSNLDGAVAAWYFDGEKMRHDYVLEQCYMSITETGLESESNTPTSFKIEGTRNIIRIGDNMEFEAESKGTHEFTQPIYGFDKYPFGKGYSILRLNHLKLKGKVDGKKITGSAYFQRVFVNAPVPQWYWGIMHFQKGAVLTYFNPSLYGKSLNKDISFFDGKKMHSFDEIKVKREGGEIPSFYVKSENEKERIEFTVKAYSHSSWTFRKKMFGLIPNKLVYNEYPSTITKFRLKNKRNGGTIILDDLGSSVGNVEHTTGLLI
ncbi:MAG: hypothetical protein ABH950_07805 [Candidatus Altiarchaeota archaeon]